MDRWLKKVLTLTVIVIFTGFIFSAVAHTITNWQGRIIYHGAHKGWYSDVKESAKCRILAQSRIKSRILYRRWSDINDFDSKNYKDSIVIHDSYLGHDLHWKAKWWVTQDDEPGTLPDSGGTSGWKLLNTIDPVNDAVWEGCDKTPTSSAQICLPTWMDGAVGAYAMISDDIGAYNDVAGYEKIWQIMGEINAMEYEHFNKYNALRIGFGIQVDKCDGTEWQHLRDCVKKGHEMLNHSYDHTSGAKQWLWFYQNDTTGGPMDEINGFTLAYGDTLPISGMCTGPDDAYVSNLSYVSTLMHVGEDMPKWASGAIVLNSEYAGKPGTETDYFGYKVKDDGDKRYIQCNGKSWIDQHQVGVLVLDCAARNDGLEIKYDGWDSGERTLNVERSLDTINLNTYEKLSSEGKLKSKYWPDEKRLEYYVYPYDAFSKETHDFLDSKNYVGARGGSKSPDATPLDFFHPFRTDFDAHFGDHLGEYPDNPHQYLTLTHMLGVIIEQKGFHTREFHTVTDEANLGWGAIKPADFRTHVEEVMTKIKAGDLFMYPPTMAVKYRITVDNMTVSITEDGNDEWTIVPDITLDPQYHERYNDIEISYIVTLPSGFTPPVGTEMKAKYVSNDEFTRRMSRKLSRRGVQNTWAVYGDPYKGNVKIYFDIVSIDESISLANSGLSFHGLKNGKVSFIANAGSYSVKLFSINGKLVKSVKGFTKGGLIKTMISDKNISKGYYILQIKNNKSIIKKGITLFK